MRRGGLILLGFLIGGISLYVLTARQVDGKVETIKGYDSLNTLRSERIKQWGSAHLTQPQDVKDRGSKLLALPVADQSTEDLLKLTEETLLAATTLSAIIDEYDKYRQENQDHSLVMDMCTPAYEAYAGLRNLLLYMRTIAFYNLGLKYRDSGDSTLAFSYFYDAFRLCPFAQEEEGGKGMRYKAEVELKKLLGLKDFPTFAYWR